MNTEEIISSIGTQSNEPMYRQALTELLESVVPYLKTHGATTADFARLERMLIPERVISFKVVWENDAGEFVHNRGYRVQFNSAIGPYKGGLRFDPSVNEDIFKFLGLEQTFKNALTGLPLGGGKGGSDFDPKEKSDREIQRFCVAFMTELMRHIGPVTDVPAGDIGVGGREIGYLYGAYKKIQNHSDGVLTGKGIWSGGSLGRTEATGNGAIYFIKHVLEAHNEVLTQKRVAISGAGNVAIHAAEKAIAEGALVLTLSDRHGYIQAAEGITLETIAQIKKAKSEGKNLSDLLLATNTTYIPGTFWQTVKADIYIPCATQNEVDEAAATAMVAAGATLIAEGANMPLTPTATQIIQNAGILLAPAKAVNAGGVAVSGLEMAQNATHSRWTAEQVDQELQKIMQQIHATCVEFGRRDDESVDYIKGANIGGFVRVFAAMKELGW